MLARWLNRNVDKLSLKHLRTLVAKLESAARGAAVPQTALIQTLKELGEIMVYGDRQSETYFEYFCERGVMRLLNEVMKSTRSAGVRTQILQTLMILLQNINNQRSLFYLLSNNQVNDLLTTTVEGNFLDEEYLAYYVSLAKALSLTLDTDTVHFFLNRRALDHHGAPRFPLYTETMRFYNHSDAMVRTAVRTIILSVWRLPEPVVRTFLGAPPQVQIFQRLAEQAAGWLRKMSEATAVAAAATRGWELRVRQSRSVQQHVHGSKYKFVPLRSASDCVATLRHADDVMETEWGEALDLLMFFGDVFALRADEVTRHLHAALTKALLQPLMQSLAAAVMLARGLPPGMHLHLAPSIPEALTTLSEQRPVGRSLFTPASCATLLPIAQASASHPVTNPLLDTPIALMATVALLRAMVDASIANELVQTLLSKPLPGIHQLRVPLPVCQGEMLDLALDGASTPAARAPAAPSSAPLPPRSPKPAASSVMGADSRAAHTRAESADSVGVPKRHRARRQRSTADMIRVQRRTNSGALRSGRDLLLSLVQFGDMRCAHAALSTLWTLAHLPGEACSSSIGNAGGFSACTPWNRAVVINPGKLAAAGLHCAAPSRKDLLLASLTSKPAATHDSGSIVSHASSAEVGRSSARLLAGHSAAHNPLDASSCVGCGTPTPIPVRSRAASANMAGISPILPDAATAQEKERAGQPRSAPHTVDTSPSPAATPGSTQSAAAGASSPRRRSCSTAASVATAPARAAATAGHDVDRELQMRKLYEHAEPRMKQQSRARAEVVEAILRALAQPDEVKPDGIPTAARGTRVDAGPWVRPFGQHRIATSLLARLIMPAVDAPPVTRGCVGTLTRLQAALLMQACQHSLDFLAGALQQPEKYGGHDALLLQIETAAMAWVQSVDYRELRGSARHVLVLAPDSDSTQADWPALPLSEATELLQPTVMLPYSSPAAALWRSAVCDLALECGPVLPVASPTYVQFLGQDQLSHTDDDAAPLASDGHIGGGRNSSSSGQSFDADPSSSRPSAELAPLGKLVPPAVTGLSSEEVATKRASHQLLDSAFSAVSAPSPAVQPPATPTRPLLMQHSARSRAEAGSASSPLARGRRPWDAASVAASAAADLQAAARSSMDSGARLAQLPAALHARSAVRAEECLAVHVARLLLLRHLLFVNCDFARAWRSDQSARTPASTTREHSDDDAGSDARSALTSPTLLSACSTSAPRAPRPQHGPLADPALVALLPRAGAVRIGQRLPAARVAWWSVGCMRGHVMAPPSLANDPLLTKQHRRGSSATKTVAPAVDGAAMVRIDGRLVPAMPSALMIGRNHVVLAGYEPSAKGHSAAQRSVTSAQARGRVDNRHGGARGAAEEASAAAPASGSSPVRGAAGALLVQTIVPVHHVEVFLPPTEPKVLVLSVLSVGEVPHLESVPHMGASRLPESLCTAGVSLHFDSTAAAQQVRALLLQRKNKCRDRKTHALRELLSSHEYSTAARRVWEAPAANDV